jgi:hypothetical protein
VVEDCLKQAIQTTQFLGDALSVRSHEFRIVHLLWQEAKKGLERDQRIADLMGDLGGSFTQC